MATTEDIIRVIITMVHNREAVVSQMDTEYNIGMGIVGECVKWRAVMQDITFRGIAVYTTAEIITQEEIMETKRGVVAYQMDTVNNIGMDIIGEIVKWRVVIAGIIFLGTIVYTTDTDEDMGKQDLVIFPMDTVNNIMMGVIGQNVR